MALCRKNLPIPLSVRSASSMQISSTPTGSLSLMRSLVTTDSSRIRLIGRMSPLAPLVDLKGECGLVKRQLCSDLSLGASFCFAAGSSGSRARSPPWVEEPRLADGPIGPSLDASGRLAPQCRRREPFLSYNIEFGMPCLTSMSLARASLSEFWKADSKKNRRVSKKVVLFARCIAAMVC
jgi:hypothetical protein